ncbi:MAG: hypothetical protein M0Z53_02965 [Thermaerobacter sp.]|nr:hypothetical protein [Thermaerobacter sp.]
MMWWTFGGIAFVAVIGLVFLGTLGGTWQTVRDGIQTVTIPQSWKRRHAAPGTVWFVSPRNHNTWVWLGQLTRTPFVPGSRAQRIPAPQPGLVEWQAATTSNHVPVLSFYGLYHHARQYWAIHIEVPANQLTLGSQILGSWQPFS